MVDEVQNNGLNLLEEAQGSLQGFEVKDLTSGFEGFERLIAAWRKVQRLSQGFISCKFGFLLYYCLNSGLQSGHMEAY
jgi:hypothetical protein